MAIFFAIIGGFRKPRDFWGSFCLVVMFLSEKPSLFFDPFFDGAFHMSQAAPEELSLLALSFARLSDPGCEPIFDQIVASLTPRRPVAWVAVIPWTAMVGGTGCKLGKFDCCGNHFSSHL